MSAEHKRLLRLAAEEMDTLDGEGMCFALTRASTKAYGAHPYFYPPHHGKCTKFLGRLYLHDSPYEKGPYWMGPEFTEEQQRHRVMALLFAAEAYDDMEGL